MFPSIVKEPDWEVELVIVIGKTCKNVSGKSISIAQCVNAIFITFCFLIQRPMRSIMSLDTWVC